MRHYGKQTLSRIALLLALALTFSGASFSQQKQEEKKQYVFRYEEDKRVLLMRFPFFYEGHLEATGTFIPDPKAAPIECKASADEQHDWIEALERKKGPIHNMNRSPGMAVLVYRYYSGLLMPGSLTGDDFTPLVDETNNTVKLITLDEYLKTYDPERHVRIYNLPGRIVPKGEAKKEKTNQKN
jgi:hypothetical protein